MQCLRHNFRITFSGVQNYGAVIWTNVSSSIEPARTCGVQLILIHRVLLGQGNLMHCQCSERHLRTFIFKCLASEIYALDFNAHNTTQVPRRKTKSLGCSPQCRLSGTSQLRLFCWAFTVCNKHISLKQNTSSTGVAFQKLVWVEEQKWLLIRLLIFQQGYVRMMSLGIIIRLDLHTLL